MIKNFKNFIKESVENKGKGPGNQDLIPTSPKKQTINRSIQTMDFLRIGKHIKTNKIDGFIDSVQNESVYISDRITGEIKKYTFKEILKEITKPKKINESQYASIDPDDNEVETPEKEDWDEGEEEEYQEEDISRGTEDNPISKKRNESWIKYWESFNRNQIDITEELTEEDDIVDEYEEFEEEVPYMGNEANPIEAKRRFKEEEYSEENPEPLPNDVAKDDSKEQFVEK